MSLPSDVVQVLFALASSCRYVPSKTPKKDIAKKWMQQLDELFDQRRKLQSEKQVFRVSPDEVHSMTQRLSMLAARDGVLLVRASDAIPSQRAKTS